MKYFNAAYQGLLTFLPVFCFLTGVTAGQTIPAQPGQDIVCTGPSYTYSYDPHLSGIDSNLTISGNCGFIADAFSPGGAYYIDTISKNNTPGVYQYTFVAEQGAVFGDAWISSRATIIHNGGTITGEYRIGEEGQPWVAFLFFDGLGGIIDIQPVDLIENIHDTKFSVRYSLNRWGYDPWDADVQLFRSSGPLPNPGTQGDFAFNFTATLVTDTDCHSSDLAGQSVFVDFFDFAKLAADYNITASGLAGDIDGSGGCDITDLLWLIDW